MKQLVEFELADGSRIVAEMDDTEPGVERASRAVGEVTKATADLGRALEQVQGFTTNALNKLRGLAERPDQIEIEFGIPRVSGLCGGVELGEQGVWE